MGFGNLSTLGKEEQQAIGAREGERLSAMFDTATADGAKVDVFDSGQRRAEASAENFSIGLQSVQPDLEIEPPESDEKVLKFDNENKEYEHFLEDGPWKAGYNDVRRSSGIDQAAVAALSTSTRPDFVAGIDKPLFYGNGIFDVYRSGPAMSRDVDVDTRPLMPKKAAEAFAYVDDGRYFYSRGPGIEGDDGSYQAAQILLDDFFTAIDDHLQGRGPHPHAAVYRFAHAEELTPFASLLAAARRRRTRQAGRDVHLQEQRLPRLHRGSAVGEHRVDGVGEGRHQHRLDLAQRAPDHGRTRLPAVPGHQEFYELDELRTCLGATG